MLQGISKARIGKLIYQRGTKKVTEQRPKLSENGEQEKDAEGNGITEEFTFDAWDDWIVTGEFDSISKAKKANGRGSITFEKVSALPQ